MNFSKVNIVDENRSFVPKVEQKNFVIHSQLKSFEKVDNKTALSIKTVNSGVERYVLNQKRHALRKGQFLLVDTNQEMQISFDEKEIAEGFCFYFDPKFINQIACLDKNRNDLDLHINSEKTLLFSTKYQIESDTFGNFLNNAIRTIQTDKKTLIGEDFFISLAEQLFYHQQKTSQEINQIKSLKLATRQELYQRVLLVREFIEDQHESKKISIETLAKIGALSEVQLHRAFKSIMRKTPHQYILERKMTKATELLNNKKQSISEVAFSLGFPDLPSFSKAFKKSFGFSPKGLYQN